MILSPNLDKKMVAREQISQEILHFIVMKKWPCTLYKLGIMTEEALVVGCSHAFKKNLHSPPVRFHYMHA